MLSSQANSHSPTHRRQNSTPTTGHRVVKANYGPTHSQTQSRLHRRGLSIDVAMQQQGYDMGMKQKPRKVSITNIGQESQQNMRAAQMPAMSRPGQEEYIRSHGNGFDSEFLEWRDFEKPGVLDPSLVSMGQPNNPFEIKSQGFLNLEDPFAPEPLSIKSPQTPSRQRILERSPMTPVTEARHNLQSMHVHSSPTRQDPLKTIKAARSTLMQRSGSYQDSFEMTRQLSDNVSIPSPPGTAPLRASATFDSAPLRSQPLLEVAELNLEFAANADYSSSNYSPTTHYGSPSIASFQSSPDLPPVNLFGEITHLPSNFTGLAPSLLPEADDTTALKRKSGSPKKSSSSKMSDSESTFNPMDYMHNDTGITEEEINAHIQGPDADGKYFCLHEDCVNTKSSTRKENVFGRKENIRAHVQTHLEDRRFECDVCYKRFVRPNDLKRHWNIHLNKRDFKCVCYAAFNRHDALKRHRERSEYCESGGKRGIPGSPKKEEKKRGRPKKIAPTETDERRERKALIRRQVLQKKQSSASSSVVSSQPSPPPDFEIPEQRLQPSHGYSPVLGSYTPPTSPGNTANEDRSPTQSFCTPKAVSMSPPPTRGSIAASLGLSTKSVADNDFNMDFLSDNLLPPVSSPPKTSSQYGTPPELEMSSSSPAPLADFNFSDDLNQSISGSDATDFLDDMMNKTTNESFDNMFSFINDGTQETNKAEDMELFRDTLQDDFYWAQS